jgi:hypothetical protein
MARIEVFRLILKKQFVELTREIPKLIRELLWRGGSHNRSQQSRLGGRGTLSALAIKNPCSVVK